MPAPQLRACRPALALLCGLLLSVGGRAEEATLPGGGRLTGTLRLDAKGNCQFVAAKNAGTFRLDQLLDIHLPPVPRPPLRWGTRFQVALAGDQQLTGELLGLDAKELRVRTAWADRLALPRAAVPALKQPQGYLTFWHDDFTNGLKAWKAIGAPTVNDRRPAPAKPCLLLTAPGQRVEYALTTPLESGRAAVSFYDAEAFGAIWLFEAEFAGAAGPRFLRVVVGGAAAYQAEGPGLIGQSTEVARNAGWHRLQVECTAASLVATVDDAVLWRGGAPGGPLKKVRLVCNAHPVKAVPRGEVALADFSLAQSVRPLRHTRADPDQDELWLASGDQLLGDVVRADHRGVELQACFGKRTYLWGDVRGVWLREIVAAPRTTDGEHVRVWLRTGCGAEVDQLDGVLHGLDAERLTLRHALLGDLVIERARVERLRGLFRGRRIEVANGSHHLGPRNRLVPSLRPPRSEGLSLKRTFCLDAVPDTAALVVRVQHLKGREEGVGGALQQGGLCTAVWVNGRQVGFLNDYVQRSTPAHQTVRLPLRREALRSGDNVLEVRQIPEPRTGQCASCGVSSMVIEVPR
jgi:hypothetical protein